MNGDQDKTVDREAWRRMLDRDRSEPPRSTDERVRAEARRALAPHTGRWWLPASLAASLLLAVLIVQWQYEGVREPQAVSEGEVAPALRTVPADASAPASDEGALDEAPAPAFEAPAAPAAAPARKQESRAESPLLETSPPAAVAPTPAPAPAAASRATNEQTSAPRIQAIAAPERGQLQNLDAQAGKMRTPEQWYADIEALRAAGRDEEAKVELAKLEAAHPGWLERNHPQPR